MSLLGRRVALALRSTASKQKQRNSVHLSPLELFAHSLPSWPSSLFIHPKHFLYVLNKYLFSDKGYIETKDFENFLDDVLCDWRRSRANQYDVAEFKRRAILFYKGKEVRWIHMSDLGDLLPILPNILLRYRWQQELSSVDFMEIWNHYHVSKGHELTYDELQGFVYDLLLKPRQKYDPRIIEAVCAEILRLHGKKENNKIGMKEMSQMLHVERNFLSSFKDTKRMTVREFDAIFQHYDKDGDGFISQDELTALVADVLAARGERVTPALVSQYRKVLMNHADADGDDQVQRDEIVDFFAYSKKITKKARKKRKSRTSSQ